MKKIIFITMILLVSSFVFTNETKAESEGKEIKYLLVHSRDALSEDTLFLAFFATDMKDELRDFPVAPLTIQNQEVNINELSDKITIFAFINRILIIVGDDIKSDASSEVDNIENYFSQKKIFDKKVKDIIIIDSSDIKVEDLRELFYNGEIDLSLIRLNPAVTRAEFLWTTNLKGHIGVLEIGKTREYEINYGNKEYLEADFEGHVFIENLEPETTYYYRIVDDGKEYITGEFITKKNPSSPYDLETFEEAFFQLGNFGDHFVIGDLASGRDVRSTLRLMLSLEPQSTESMIKRGLRLFPLNSTVLVSEIQEPYKKNIISVGSLCDNSLNREILGIEESKCETFFEEGEALIKLLFNGDYYTHQLIITGYDEYAVEKAVNILIEKENIDFDFRINRVWISMDDPQLTWFGNADMDKVTFPIIVGSTQSISKEQKLQNIQRSVQEDPDYMAEIVQNAELKETLTRFYGVDASEIEETIYKIDENEGNDNEFEGKDDNLVLNETHQVMGEEDMYPNMFIRIINWFTGLFRS